MSQPITPEIQAAFTNKLLTEFATGLDQVLRARLAAIGGRVPEETIKLLRYNIIQASASDISAKYELYFQDSARISEMRNINQTKAPSVDDILDWLEKRPQIVKTIPGYRQGVQPIRNRKSLERVAFAIAKSKVGQLKRSGRKLKERQWLNPNFYSWYDRLIADFIKKQPELLGQMVKDLMEPLQTLQISA